MEAESTNKSETNKNKETKKKKRDSAVGVIGKACLKAQLASNNPGVKADQLKTQFKDEWKANRRNYIKLAKTVIRRLKSLGYELTPPPGSTLEADSLDEA